jgi:exodeoxyribonuclease VII large subunit
LQAEGLFDSEKKKRLPLLPGRIGIVTSPTGAVIRDMIDIIGRRWPGMCIVFAPASVQGDTAGFEIARSIELLNTIDSIDVVIIGRGGGSIEELWAFNTEIVARSIFNSRIPVVSAVGHETDFTIADFVADVRAATPSAAAELVVPVKQEMLKLTRNLKDRLFQGTQAHLNRCMQRLEACLDRPVIRRPVHELCTSKEQQLDFISQKLLQSTDRLLEQNRNRLAVQVNRLETLSPLATLARGYSICSRADSHQIIRSAEETAEGEPVHVDLFKGRLLCLVKDTIPE